MAKPKIKLFQNSFLRRTAIVLIISAILLSLLLAFFQLYQRSLIRTLTQMNNEFVEQVDTISGTLLEIIHNSAMQTFYSGSLVKLRTVDPLTNAERVAGFRDLGNWVSSSTFLSSAMIYNSSADIMYTSDGGYTRNASVAYYDQETVSLMAARERHGSKGPIRRQTEDGDTYSFLFFESNMPERGSLLLNVEAQWYEEQLLGLSSENNSVVVNNAGHILVAGDESLTHNVSRIWPTLLTRLEDNGRSHGFILGADGKSGLMYYQMTNLGGYYLRFFETNTILPGLVAVRNVVLGLLIAVSVLLVGGALYTLFALYLPFRAIREALQKDGNANETVVQQVDRLLEGKMEQQLTKQMDSLLQGEELGIISYPASLILVDSSDSEAIRSAVATSASSPALTALVSFGCAVIVGEESAERMLELCLNIADATGARCLYGKPSHSASELAQCYGNLLDLWQQRFLYADQQVLSETLTTTYHSSDFETKDTEPLFSALRAGELDEARSIWKGIFGKIRDANFNDFRFYTKYILKYLNTMQSELGLEPLANATDLFDDLEDIAELHQLLDTIFARIVAEQVDLRKNHLQQLATKINERIAAGYNDENLSAQSIADEMGMNAVYLGRLYRESTGISIGEALKRTRIENAKRLLIETSDSVKEIASRVGFSNNKYFFVVFKELVGITPKEFQAQEIGESK